jgi:hypothetical protein
MAGISYQILHVAAKGNAAVQNYSNLQLNPVEFSHSEKDLSSRY